MATDSNAGIVGRVAGSGFVAACLASIERTFRPHRPLYVAAIVFCTLSAVIASAYGVPLSLSASQLFLKAIPIFLFVVVTLAALRQLFYLLLIERPARPIAAMGQWLAQSFLAGDRPGNVFHAVVTFTPLMISFVSLKRIIPIIQPFGWDKTFADWDRFLAFGYEPFELLQAFLGYPIVTSAINVIYNLWLAVMFLCLFAQAFGQRTSRLRLQFLLAFAFTWFGAGNVLAVLFSSAGPCYYGRLGFSPDIYAAQMAYLHQAASAWPVWSLAVQDMLWNSYVTGHGAVNGISAMPSVHVTSSAIMMFLGWRLNRWAGAALTLFFTVILLGSVHLAWHYAVDGIAGILLAVVFWAAAGAIAKRTIPAPE